MVTLSRSPKLYFERRLPQDRNTRRRPGPRSDYSRTLVHSLSMAPPLPTPAVLHAENDKPPDAGATQPWPHGMAEIQ